MIGKDISKMSSTVNNRYGYLFIVDNSSITNICPDEDYIGMILNDIISNTKYHNKYSDKLKPDDKEKFKNLAKNVLTTLQYDKVKRYDDYGDLAVAGKKLMKIMPDNLKLSLIETGIPIANTGNVKIQQAYSFDKNKCVELNRDASNFFDLASRIM